MTTYSPVIRQLGSDRRIHTTAASAHRWTRDRSPHTTTVSTIQRRTLDRRPRAAWVLRRIGLDRTLIGAVYSGPGIISGNFDAAGVGKHVYVLLDQSHERIADGYADPITGNFSFSGLLAGQRYTVILEDETGEFAPQIWSHVVPL